MEMEKVNNILESMMAWEKVNYDLFDDKEDYEEIYYMNLMKLCRMESKTEKETVLLFCQCIRELQLDTYED